MTSLYLTIGGVLTFIVSCFTFWKMGKNNGKKEEKLENEKAFNESLSRACTAVNTADYDKLRKKYKGSAL